MLQKQHEQNSLETTEHSSERSGNVDMIPLTREMTMASVSDLSEANCRVVPVGYMHWQCIHVCQCVTIEPESVKAAHNALCPHADSRNAEGLTMHCALMQTAGTQRGRKGKANQEGNDAHHIGDGSHERLLLFGRFLDITRQVNSKSMRALAIQQAICKLLGIVPLLLSHLHRGAEQL